MSANNRTHHNFYVAPCPVNLISGNYNEVCHRVVRRNRAEVNIGVFVYEQPGRDNIVMVSLGVGVRLHFIEATLASALDCGKWDITAENGTVALKFW